MRKGVLAAIVVVLVIGRCARAADQIRLKSRNFTPEPGISSGAKARFQSAPAGKAHVLIQLDRKMTRAYRKSLETQGVKLLGYIPQWAWFAAVDSRKAEDIVKIPVVRAMCDILPTDKIAPSIRASASSGQTR